jgi:3D (Asp-Asp-Asp) domain-containing protein
VSFQGALRTRWIACGIAGLGVFTLGTIFNRASAQTDGNSSRPNSAKSETPAPATPVNGAAEEVKEVVQREPIPYPTLRKSSSELRSGSSKTVRAGINGEKKITYRVTYRDGVEVRREAVSTKVVKNPVPEVVAVGYRTTLASRGYLSGRKMFVMSATSYSPSPRENGGRSRTATGLHIGHGIVAVDPRFIPLGTRLYIEGYGYAVAGDTGGAIKGNRIDLGHDSTSASNRFGRRKVKVYILD